MPIIRATGRTRRTNRISRQPTTNPQTGRIMKRIAPKNNMPRRCEVRYQRLINSVEQLDSWWQHESEVKNSCESMRKIRSSWSPYPSRGTTGIARGPARSSLPIVWYSFDMFDKIFRRVFFYFYLFVRLFAKIFSQTVAGRFFQSAAANYAENNNGHFTFISRNEKQQKHGYSKTFPKLVRFEIFSLFFFRKAKKASASHQL